MGLTVALVLAEILNVVQVFTPAHAVTVCYCCYCCSAASKQKTAKNPGKTRKYLGFPGYFRVLPALDAGDRRGSLPGLPYCCSAGLTLATVVGEPHCCSVVTVNTSNTVQLPTLNSSTASNGPDSCVFVHRGRPQTRNGNGWVVGLEGRSTLSLCSERALNLAPAPSRAQT